jgi:hypothetical protein
MVANQDSLGSQTELHIYHIGGCQLAKRYTTLFQDQGLRSLPHAHRVEMSAAIRELSRTAASYRESEVRPHGRR